MNRSGVEKTHRLLVPAILWVGLAATGCSLGWMEADNGETSSPDAGVTDTSEADEARPKPPSTRMRRLSAHQYQNAIRQLLPLESLPEMQLPADVERGSQLPATSPRPIKSPGTRVGCWMTGGLARRPRDW